MKFQLKPERITAVKWKGWPHKIKGLEKHPIYPQLAYLVKDFYLIGTDVYKGNWIITDYKGKKSVMNDFEFKNKYEQIK